MSVAAGQVEVSVIVPCHNSTRTLGLQLEALAGQVGAPPFEVILADNGSGDGLSGFLDGWRDRLNLHYVDAGYLPGAAYARNVGMSNATASKWLFCDSDDVVARDWVAQGSAALDEVEVFSGPGLKVLDAQMGDDLEAAWQRLDAGLPPGEPLQRGRMVAWPIILGGNSGLRREVALDVGGYDAGLSHGIEDNDLAVRLQLSGRTIAAAPAVRILYRERGGLRNAYERARVASEWHMALCERHDLWDRSPHLGGGQWRLEPLRCLLSGLRMVLRPSSRDWLGLASRSGLAVGMWRGWWRFHRKRRLPDSAVGAGLGHDTTRGRTRAVVFMPGVLNGGGAERYAVGLAASLAELGYESILATTDTEDRAIVGSHFGIDLSRVRVVDLASPPSWTKRLPQAVFDLAEEATWQKAVRALRPGLFINCLYRSELVGVGDQNIYICHFPHRLDATYTGALRGLYMALMSRIRTSYLRGGKDFLDTYDVVCANSRFSAGNVRDRWGLEPTVLYPPCAPIVREGEDRRRRIIAVGRMEPPVEGVPNKRHDVLIQAFAQLTDLHAQGWELHVVGACPERSRDYLEELRARASGAPVFFHPNATFEELRELYATSTLYWHAQGFGEDATGRPETQEHFGITTVEAMSAGVIPIVIDTAGPREVVAAVPSLGRWTTIAQLHSETRRMAALPEADLDDLSRLCIERAGEFDSDQFRARLVQILRGNEASAESDWLRNRPLLVLSPHLDDALFSASEFIRRGDVEVWTVFAGEPEPPITTAWDRTVGFADSRAQMMARWREDLAAFAGTGAAVRHMPCLDGAYTTPERRKVDLEILRREVMNWVDVHAGREPVVVVPAGAGVPVPGSRVGHTAQVIVPPRAVPVALAPVYQALRDVKHRAYLRRRRRASKGGLAVNGDHLAVRDAVIEVLATGNRATLVLAEDLPYLWWQPADDEVGRVAAGWGLRAMPGAFDVDRQWKHERIRHYASQVIVMDAEHGRLASADSLPTKERFWVCTPLPDAESKGLGKRVC